MWIEVSDTPMGYGHRDAGAAGRWPPHTSAMQARATELLLSVQDAKPQTCLRYSTEII